MNYRPVLLLGIASLVLLGCDSQQSEAPVAPPANGTDAGNASADSTMMPLEWPEGAPPEGAPPEVAAEPAPAAPASGAPIEESTPVEQPAPVAFPDSSADNAPPQTSEPGAACYDCATVIAITPVEVKGGASGAGAAIGAVVGGLLGNQVGDGKGRDLATIAGAIGGGLAGHELEQRRNATEAYDISFEYDTGGTTVIRVDDPGLLQVGMPVRIENGVILPRD